MKSFMIIFIIILPTILFGQDSAAKRSTWTLSGYLKDLEWVRFENGIKNVTSTNLVHNRFNIKWSPTKNLTGRLEIRNRLYWGDDTQLPGFRNQLRNDNEWMNLSTTWFEGRSTMLHTNVERLSVEYKKAKWNVRAGRQRVNWGINSTWNPNDLFNSYNFLDFDYEERPGSDAIKAQYLISDLSNVEVAAAVTGNRSIVAAKYYTNYRKFDLQWNAGVYQNTITAGFGWAGSIKDAGFKGEAQYYVGGGDSLARLLLSVESDYMFKSGWYVSSAFLYNDKGWDRPLDGRGQLMFEASPRSLMPSKWNLLLATSREFTPIIGGSMNVVFAPGTNLLILFPAFSYNVKTNLDVDLVWQSFFAEATRFEALLHIGYVRLKWSF